jgi:hypothetical protein
MLLNLALLCTITTACSVRRYFTKTPISPCLPALANGRLLINAPPVSQGETLVVVGSTKSHAGDAP